jgi:hypothetical protein
VHAGLLTVGQEALLRVTCGGELTGFTGTTANGVTTIPWATEWESIALTVDPAPPAETCYQWWCARQCVTAGQEFELVVKGQTSTAEQSVWGDVVYSQDSDIRAAAVHAGVLADGEQATLVVSCHGRQPSYPGITRYGVTSVPWGEYPYSWSIRKKVA